VELVAQPAISPKEVGRFSLWFKGRGGQKAKKLALVSERGGDDMSRSFTEGGELSDGKNKILADYREGKQRVGRSPFESSNNAGDGSGDIAVTGSDASVGA
jgi:hypothetical protein